MNANLLIVGCLTLFCSNIMAAGIQKNAEPLQLHNKDQEIKTTLPNTEKVKNELKQIIKNLDYMLTYIDSDFDISLYELYSEAYWYGAYYGYYRYFDFIMKQIEELKNMVDDSAEGKLMSTKLNEIMQKAIYQDKLEYNTFYLYTTAPYYDEKTKTYVKGEVSDEEKPTFDKNMKQHLDFKNIEVKELYNEAVNLFKRLYPQDTAPSYEYNNTSEKDSIK